MRSIFLSLLICSGGNAALVNNSVFPNLEFRGPLNSLLTIDRFADATYYRDDGGPIQWISEPPQRIADISLQGIGGVWEVAGNGDSLTSDFITIRLVSIRETPASEYLLSMTNVLRSGITRRYYQSRPAYVYESLRRLTTIDVLIDRRVGGGGAFSGTYVREVAVPEPTMGLSLLLLILSYAVVLPISRASNVIRQTTFPPLAAVAFGRNP